VQEDWLLGTAPLLVEGLNVQEIVNTVVPAGCWTVIVADVKATSVIVSVQCELGQRARLESGLSVHSLLH
jgi:hypothetical protein